MTFDSGTWWLIATIAAGLIGAVTFFTKRIVDRVDNCVTKADHEKDLKECKDDIKKIKEDFITKDDFLREMGKFDRKLDRQDEKIDRLINMLLRERGLTND